MTATAAAHRSSGLAIFGAFGGVNIGDEVILRAAADQARRVGYTGDLIALGPIDPEASAIAADYTPHGIRFVNWRRPIDALKVVRGRDLFIGGGQLIDGLGGVKGPLLQAALAGVSRVSGGRVMIGGVSTARLERPSVRAAYRLLFKAAYRIVTRDAASLQDILALAPEAARKASTEADIVFSMLPAFRGGLPLQQRKSVAFAVHATPGASHSDVTQTATFLRRALAVLAPDQQLHIIAHDIRADWDLGCAQAIADQLGSSRVTVTALEHVDRCIDFYRDVRSVISARMHPIIMAACAGAHCIPLATSRKVEDIAPRLGVPIRRLEELECMSAPELTDALGIGDRGPLPNTAMVERLSQQALTLMRD